MDYFGAHSAFSAHTVGQRGDGLFKMGPLERRPDLIVRVSIERVKVVAHSADEERRVLQRNGRDEHHQQRHAVKVPSRRPFGGQTRQHVPGE